MRKRNKKGRSLSRPRDQKKALLRTMLVSLIENKRIQTTLAKAKELRPYAEKMLTKARKGLDKIKRAMVIRELNKEIPASKAGELIDMAKKFEKKPGGYTRIIKLSNRKSDNAPEALIEWTEDFEELKKEEKKGKNKDEKKDKKDKK